MGATFRVVGWWRRAEEWFFPYMRMEKMEWDPEPYPIWSIDYRASPCYTAGCRRLFEVWLRVERERGVSGPYPLKEKNTGYSVGPPLPQLMECSTALILFFHVSYPFPKLPNYHFLGTNIIGPGPSFNLLHSHTYLDSGVRVCVRQHLNGLQNIQTKCPANQKKH